MFFTKYIKSKSFYNKVITCFISIFIRISRIFIFPNKRNINILVVSFHRLGDSIFTINAVKSIVNFHKRNICLICFSETIPIYQISLSSVNYIGFTSKDFLFSRKLAKGTVRKIINKLNPKIIYDLTGNVTSASAIFRSKAIEIIGINEPYYQSIYTSFKNIRKEPHIIDNYLDAIRSIIPVPNYNNQSIIVDNSGEYILIHPFASFPSKEWGLKKYIQLTEQLSKNHKCLIIFPPLRMDNDVKLELYKKRLEFVETNSVSELIDVIRNCFLFIGNDSGPIHIANLLGKPTFTIYGPTNPDYVKPLSGTNNYTIKKMHCSAEGNNKFCKTFGGVFCPSYECVQNLNYYSVEEQVLNFFE